MQRIKIQIRNDGFNASAPWCADVEFEDGNKWVSWQSGFRSRRALLANVYAAIPAGFNATVYRHCSETGRQILQAGSPIGRKG